MATKLPTASYPELVFGIVGPIGLDMDLIQSSIDAALRAVSYKSNVIKISSLMEDYDCNFKKETHQDYYDLMNYKIKFADCLCKEKSDPSFLAKAAIRAIRFKRDEISPDGSIPPQTAYIVRQFKRPEEVEIFRSVYGKQFVLIAAYGSVSHRQRLLEAKIKRSSSTLLSDIEISCRAGRLIATDASEELEPFGQQLRETFHLGDAFVDGTSRHEMDAKVQRFINAFFGKTDISPTKHEYGMYTAKSASLRSSDLSRQVGAAIFSEQGDIITQGCNEVPKAFGGTYWDLEVPDYRDVRIGLDPNDVLKRGVLRNLLEKLSDEGLLSDKAKSLGSPTEMVQVLISKRKTAESDDCKGALIGAEILDLTEYGRVVHAEMCAICDAARLGRSIQGATLFCTTFPCHNCTKHILASGIRKVIYMEPYPKSRAKALHENEIEIEAESSDRVIFLPFLGISPARYRDIFQKGKRKDSSGFAKTWLDDEPRPMLNIFSPNYIELEKDAIISIFCGEMQDIFGTDDDLK